MLQIEGDGAGTVDSVHTVGATNADGYWTPGLLGNAFENGAVSLLLVEGFTGAAGDDLDTDDDGTLDTTPWSRLIDAIAVSDGGTGHGAYGHVILEPGFDGDTFTVGGASRIPDATDTDAASDWTRNDFDGAGLAGVPRHARSWRGTQYARRREQHRARWRRRRGVRRVWRPGHRDPRRPGRCGDLFIPGADDVTVGDLVRVQAVVTEFETSGGASSLTELADLSDLELCDTAALPAPATVELPVTSRDDFERYEGMRAVFPQDLVISEYFNYDRFGEVVLALPLDGAGPPVPAHRSR